MRDHYEEFLRAVPVFRPCSRKELVQISRLVERLDTHEGQTIISEGAYSREFYLIVEGEAEVVRDGATVAVLGVGDHFGELAGLDPAPRNATVRMRTSGRLLCLPEREFASLLHSIPAVTVRLLRTLATRVHALDLATAS